ncbi:MAG: helix-turn-helix transcriptional regulator [Alphaproteobacteria bacterium]
MLLTPDQIRAGRALINWSQADLAQRSGLARPTIVNIETGVQAPELKTLEKIVKAFDEGGVHFGVNESVHLRAQNVKIYRGSAEVEGFFRGVHNFAKSTGGDIFVSNVDERTFEGSMSREFVQSYYARMTASNKNINFKILIKEGDDFMPASSYASYKWDPKERFADVPFYVYGDCLSIFLFLDEPIIISLYDQEAADTFKEKFLIQWKTALPVKKKK